MHRIHFIRHGLSEANLSTSVNRRKADHAIELAPEGHHQAARAGDALAHHFNERGDAPGRIRMLISPYRRTRDTALQVISALARRGYQVDARESLQLREQSFGLFDGLTPAERREIYPREYDHYLKHRDFEGEFYAPMPGGESRARVCDRVRGVFGSILRDFSSTAGPAITDAICISHGVTIRCAIMEFLHLPWEWNEQEPNPANCSIKTLAGRENEGWTLEEIFTGFPAADQHVQPMREARA